MSNMLNLTLKVWRQAGPDDPGRFEEYRTTVADDASFLEMLDYVNEQLIDEDRDPIAFDHDCREGICGSCGLMIDGQAHGPQRGTATCQLHMRKFHDGDHITIEPFRAAAFPVIKDLAVNRAAFDRIVESGAPLAVWLPREAPAPVAPAHALQVTVDLPIKPDYPPLPEILAELERATEPYQRERAQRKARLRKTLGDAATYPFKIWVWRLGSCVFVGQEGEGFSSLQTDLRAAFPDLAVVVMNVTNGSIGYLPPSALYDVDMYEVWQTPLARGCLEAVTAAAKGAIEELLARG